MNATTRLTRGGGLAHLRALEDAVAHFRSRFRSRHDPVLEHTMTAGSLTEAIERACAGLTADGRKFRHDQYLQPSAVENLRQVLTSHMRELAAAENFDTLYDSVRSLRPKGVGNLKIFDVSMRLGAYLNINLERSASTSTAGHWLAGRT